MEQSIIAGLGYARNLLVVAAVMGGGAGWFALLTRDGTDAMVEVGIMVFPLLIIALPLALILNSLFDQEMAKLPEANIYRAGKQPTSIMLASGGLLGSIAGVMIYLLLVPLATGSFGGEDLNAVREALWAQVQMWQVLAVIGLTTLAGFLMGQFGIRK